MEKRYYFRGLGLGIIVTAVIMGIALSGRSSQRTMTDDEVIARAKKLGMIEDSRLLTPSDSDKEESDANEADAQENGEPGTVQTPVKTDVAVAEPENASEQGSGEAETTPAADVRPEAETKPDTNEMNKQDEDMPSETSEVSSVEMKSITIVSGDGSFKVSQKLAEAGIVNNAASFDTYLCENGYDKRLRTGTFRIPADAGDEQIARIVTGQE